MLKALIIDDEPLAHDVILHHLQSHSDIVVYGQCFHATEALHWLAEHQADLIFLDVNMPVLSGMDMLKVMHCDPQVIIVSAHQEYALQGYEFDITDYLLKPVSAERLSKALQKVRKRVREKVQNVAESAPIVVKIDRERRKIEPDTICYLEAYGNYVKVWQDKEMLLVNSTLKQLLAQLPQGQFAQVHKSFVVNTTKVIGQDKDHLLIQGEKRIKIGKMYKTLLGNLL